MRPTLYKPEYCDELIEMCAGGHSLTGFAGKIRVSRSTVSEWAKTHPEFREAVEVAKAAAVYGVELDAARVRKGGGGPGAAQLIAFSLRNLAPDDYRDIKQDNDMSPAQLAAMVAPVDISRADEPGPKNPRL